MQTDKSLTICLLLVAAALVKSRPINYYKTNYAPAHDYNDQDQQDYSFSYGVKDVHTGDLKTQWEKKEGDVVTGHYSVLEADGSVRTVEYTADEIHGFNAVVKHDRPAHHPLNNPVSSHQEFQMNQIQPQPTLDDDGQHRYQHSESKPVVSMYSFKAVENVPQTEANEIQKTFVRTDQDLQALQTQPFKPSPVIQLVDSVSPITSPPKTRKHPHLTRLPVDLSILAGGQNLIPVDISLISPVEINLPEATLTKLKDEQQFQPSYQFNDYNQKFNEGIGEADYKPIPTNPTGVPLPPKIPNTFISGKTPATTPGLRYYTSQGNPKPKPHPAKVQTYQGIDSRLVPYLFAKQLSDINQETLTLQKAEVTRLHPSVAKNKNAFVTYAKRVTYDEEDK